MSGISKVSLARLILREILSSLPGRRRLSQQEPPEDPFDLFSQSIYTGALNSGKMIKVQDRLLGIFLWIAWFGLGVYFWWFTEVPLGGYVIGTLVWGLIFIFTLIGIPVTRAIFRYRYQ